jgi:hypothetical protein
MNHVYTARNLWRTSLDSSTIGSNIRRENLRAKLRGQSKSLVSTSAGEIPLKEAEGEHGFIVKA